jgi:membrane protein required for colicin V production
VVAYLFLVWLIPAKSQPTWVQEARSKPVLQGTGDWLLSVLPDDPEGTILKRLKKPKDTEEGSPTDAPVAPGAAPGQRSELNAPARVAADSRSLNQSINQARSQNPESSYKRNDRQGFDQLIESTSGSPR